MVHGTRVPLARFFPLIPVFPYLKEQVMPSIFDSVTEQLSGANLTQLSQQIGADEATTSQAASMIARTCIS